MVGKRGVVSFEGLTKGILLGLGSGAIIGVALLFPGAGWIFKEFQKEKWESAKKRGALNSTLRRLEKQKLISWREIDGTLRLSLTDEGKRRVLQYNIDDLSIKKNKKDGLFRVIVFDIPEYKKTEREIFREKLKQLGFFQLQKSTFVTMYECKDEIDFLRHNLDIASCIQYILAKEISGLKDMG